jgi:hypothetical protein
VRSIQVDLAAADQISGDGGVTFLENVGTRESRYRLGHTFERFDVVVREWQIVGSPERSGQPRQMLILGGHHSGATFRIE